MGTSLIFYALGCGFLLFFIILAVRKLHKMIVEDEVRVKKEQEERHKRQD